MSNTCPNPECGAGSDAFLEEPGQMVCMDCGTVVGGIISYEADYEPAGSSSNVSSHARQTLSGGSLDWRRVEARVREMCEKLHLDEENMNTAQQLTKMVLVKPRTGVPLEATAACCVLLTTRRDVAGAVLTLREVSNLAKCPPQAVGQRWMRLMLQLQQERRQQQGGGGGGGGAAAATAAGASAAEPDVAAGAIAVADAAAAGGPLVGSGARAGRADLDPKLLLERLANTLKSAVEEEGGRAAAVDGPARAAAAAAGRALGRDGAARALAEALLETATQEWLMEGRRPEPAVAAALAVACKASRLKGAPFEPDKGAVERLLEALELPVSEATTVRKRVKEIKAVVVALARSLPGRQTLSDAVLARSLPEIVSELRLQRQAAARALEFEAEEARRRCWWSRALHPV